MNKQYEPIPKSPAVERMLENLFGRTTAIKGGTCALCGKAVTSFKDALSEKEYTISGSCQKCQDSVFAP